MKNLISCILSLIMITITRCITYYCMKFKLFIPFIIILILCFVCVIFSMLKAKEINEEKGEFD
jgi:cbb3-type cytochrome oxidase subunit 3